MLGAWCQLAAGHRGTPENPSVHAPDFARGVTGAPRGAEQERERERGERKSCAEESATLFELWRHPSGLLAAIPRNVNLAVAYIFLLQIRAERVWREEAYPRPQARDCWRSFRHRIHIFSTRLDRTGGGGGGCTECKMASTRSSRSSTTDLRSPVSGWQTFQPTSSTTDRRSRVSGWQTLQPKTQSTVVRRRQASDLPVLDWWRGQRISEAAGLRQDQHLPGNSSGSLVKTETSDPCTAVVEKPWSKAQLHSLRRAQAHTSPSTPDFWGEVAGNVEGRDPLACQQKWFEHFATPQGRRRKASKRESSSQETGTPLSDITTRLTQDAVTARHDSPTGPKRSDTADDLFQATPLRGRRQFGIQPTGGEGESNTPRTPAGPSGPYNDASAVEATPGDGRADFKRGISRTYVQAVSKKMRKGASQLGGGRIAARGMASRNPTSSGKAGRTIHAAAVSSGCKLTASVTSSGTVNVASFYSDEDSLGLSGDESDDE